MDKWEGIVLNRDEMTAYAGSVPMAQAAKTLLKKRRQLDYYHLDKDGALLITLTASARIRRRRTAIIRWAAATRF